MDTPIIDHLMENVKPGWWEFLEREAVRERARHAYWEQHYRADMTYDEFIERANKLQLAAARAW